MANSLSCKHEHVVFDVYRSGLRHDIQSTCQQCGRQWIVTEAVEDLAETVTSTEQIELHKQLAGNKTLQELISGG